MNKVIISGNLGNDPEVRYTQNGKCVASFSLAVRRDSNNTDWIPVTAWEKVGESAGNALKKGSKCLVEGRIQVRQYENSDGSKRRVTEVIAQHIEYLDRKQTEQKEEFPFGGQEMPDSELPF